MVMYFQDDFWDAIKELPDKDRKDAAMALLEYHFEGSTDETNPVAIAILTISKKRIELSKTRSNAKKGKTKSESNQEQKQIKSESNQKQIEATTSISLSDSKADCIDWDNPTGDDAEFIMDALKVFNDEAGADIASIDSVTQCSLIEIRARGRTADDLRSVVRCKVRQWGGDEKMSRYIRPSTLYSREHFEEYLAESKRKTKSKEESGVKWDAELAGYAERLDF